MKKKGYGLLLTAWFLCTVVLLSAVPVFAADMAGKKVTAIEVAGNKVVSTENIKAVLQLKTGDVLTGDAVRKDMQAIYDLGFFYDIVVNFTEEPEGVRVTYTVMENPLLTSVVVKGNTKVTTEQIVAMVKAEKNSIINMKSLNDNMRAIEQYYHDQGYILAKVSDVSTTREGTLIVTINEGMLENIVVKGNDKTKDYVITREMTIKPGEPFNAKLAKRSMQKVYNLGYFEDVNMKLNPGREPNAVSMETDVVEQKTGTFSIGGGYSQSDGLVGIIELGDNNLGGTGDKAKIHWEFGGNASSRNYEFTYTHPWLDAKQTSVSFSIYNMTNQYTDYGLYNSDGSYNRTASRSTYDKNRKGYEFTFGRPHSENMTDYVTFKNRKDTWVSQVSGTIDYSSTTDSHFANYMKDNFGLTRSITLTRVFDDRDNVFSPTEGSRFSVSSEYAGRFLKGDFDFNKYTIEGRKYFKTDDDHVIAVRVMGGYATGHVSEANQFSLGGSENLRGYDDDEFKGNRMVEATAEYRFPIVKKVQGVFFTDAGNAWTDGGFKVKDLRKSYGVGIRLTTPIGPIRFDFAKGQEGNKTHFSFGGQF